MKKKEQEVEPEGKLLNEPQEVNSQKKIDSFLVDFGREDLNALRNKVNEIVERLNR